MKIKSFFKFFRKKIEKEYISNLKPNKIKEYTKISVPENLNLPKFIIRFSDKDNPFIPYYYTEGQDQEWTRLPFNGFFYYDPIEDTPEYKNIIQTVNKMVDAEMGETSGRIGSCHKAWAIQKRILKELYGIEWHSVSDLNPQCHFD